MVLGPPDVREQLLRRRGRTRSRSVTNSKRPKYSTSAYWKSSIDLAVLKGTLPLRTCAAVATTHTVGDETTTPLLASITIKN